MIAVTIAGQPLPKPRPRVTKRGTYTPPKYKLWETTVSLYTITWMSANRIDPLTGDVAVTLHFRRKGKRRADLDNLVKAVLDALNGVAYGDDDQVTRIVATVTYNAPEPGVGVTVSTGPIK